MALAQISSPSRQASILALPNAKQATMLALLEGSPRKNFTDECQAVTHDELKRLQRTESVGPFRATGLAPALESLRTVMTRFASRSLRCTRLLEPRACFARLVRGRRSLSVTMRGARRWISCWTANSIGRDIGVSKARRHPPLQPARVVLGQLISAPRTACT